MSNTEEDKMKAVDDGLKALFGQVEIAHHTPRGRSGRGFAVILADRRHFNFEVSEGYWDDHTDMELAQKMRESDLEEMLKNSFFKLYRLTNTGVLMSESSVAVEPTESGKGEGGCVASRRGQPRGVLASRA